MKEKQLIPVEDNQDLVRDSLTGAIINISVSKLEEAKNRKLSLLREKAKITTLEQKLNSIENRLDDALDKFEQIIDLLGKL